MELVKCTIRANQIRKYVESPTVDCNEPLSSLIQQLLHFQQRVGEKTAPHPHPSLTLAHIFHEGTHTQSNITLDEFASSS